MTRKQKRQQKQRILVQRQQAASEDNRKKNVKRNKERQERRKRAKRGLLTTQPAYHEKVRLIDEARQVLHKREQDLRETMRRQRQRRKVAIFTAMAA